MSKSRNASVVLQYLVVAVLVAAGGSCDTREESASNANERDLKEASPSESKPYVLNSMMGEILHEERLSPTSAVQWLELEPGLVIMGRYGHADKDRLPTDSPKIEAGTLPSQTFKALFPGKSPPESLLRADERVKNYDISRNAILSAALPMPADSPPLEESNSTSTGENPAIAPKAQKEKGQIVARMKIRPADSGWDWNNDAYWFANQLPGVGGDVGACNGPNGGDYLSSCVTNDESGQALGYGGTNSIGLRFTGMAAGMDTNARFKFWVRTSHSCFLIFGTCYSWDLALDLTLQPRYYYQANRVTGAWGGLSGQIQGTGPGYRVHMGWDEHMLP
jgi:hypothetical protein